MNEAEKFQTIKHGLGVLTLWNRITREAEEASQRDDWPVGRSSAWYKHDARQAYHDAMNSLVRMQLIDDFDVVRIRVQLAGQWYGYDDIPEQYKLRFVREGG